MKTVRLTTCNDSMQAHILQGALENEGIESVLHNEHFSSLLPGFTNIMGAGVQLFVMDCDYDRALEVLRRNEAVGKQYCPHCGATEIRLVLGKRRGVKAFFAAMSLLLVSPMGNIRSVYQCRVCKAEFDVPSETPSTIEEVDDTH